MKAWQDFFDEGDYSIEEPEQVVIKMPEGMKRKSIFYELPYLNDLLTYHILDPMQILKNVPDLICLHTTNKEKDTLS